MPTNTNASHHPAATEAPLSPAGATPSTAELAHAPGQFPDGPNVAPSAHELQAARGHLPPQATRAPKAGHGDGDQAPGDGGGAAPGTPSAGA